LEQVVKQEISLKCEWKRSAWALFTIFSRHTNVSYISGTKRRLQRRN
jgi:hypothetical protein